MMFGFAISVTFGNSSHDLRAPDVQGCLLRDASLVAMNLAWGSHTLHARII